MKKIKGFYFEIEDRIYNVPILVVFGDYDYNQKILKSRLGFEDEGQKYSGGEAGIIERQEINNGKITKSLFSATIWIPELTFTIDNYGAIAHEVLHVALHNLKKVGFNLDYENQEPLNYYFEYLYKQIIDKCFKQYKKRKKI